MYDAAEKELYETQRGTRNLGMRNASPVDWQLGNGKLPGEKKDLTRKEVREPQIELKDRTFAIPCTPHPSYTSFPNLATQAVPSGIICGNHRRDIRKICIARGQTPIRTGCNGSFTWPCLTPSHTQGDQEVSRMHKCLAMSGTGTRHEARIPDERIVGDIAEEEQSLVCRSTITSRTLLEPIGGASKTQTLARSRNENSTLPPGAVLRLSRKQPTFFLRLISRNRCSMPRDASGPANGRSKTYEALVKSLFTNMSHVKELDVPPRPQSRIGFRRNKSPKTKHGLQPDRASFHVDDTTAAAMPSAHSDEDTADSETSDEWSTDSDTSDTTFSSDLTPCFPAPSTPPPILVPDAFPDQDPLPTPSELPMPMHRPPMFPHHGLSRSALQHQKWLWNTRYDEWMQWRADVDSAEAAEMDAYGGITNPKSEYVGKKAEMNEKIFPRTGDLTDLHDPQVVRLDQTFCNYPLWTIQKVLLVCSMDTAARGEGPCSSRDSERADDNQETEGALESDSTIPLLTRLRWEQSWHTRWEVLTALVRMTERAVLAQGPTTIPATVTTPIGLPVVARSLTDVVMDSSATRVPTRFFLAGSERLGGVDGSESDEDDDEDEDDYGEILLNPRFSIQRGKALDLQAPHITHVRQTKAQGRPQLSAYTLVPRTPAFVLSERNMRRVAVSGGESGHDAACYSRDKRKEDPGEDGSTTASVICLMIAKPANDTLPDLILLSKRRQAELSAAGGPSGEKAWTADRF
ncbi:hypothetical protein EDB92DRAFT_1819707 [Lactarius akahatsu]|uniref:Uncharacterized protein n=1 Tax=Lactarius akahatsu TaxID=416441 RepID=A0AAD4L9R9_9AGAM|nr:hypothetical protein EDB92DRAFT_1819707 [Lactarius akahatsu]